MTVEKLVEFHPWLNIRAEPVLPMTMAPPSPENSRYLPYHWLVGGGLGAVWSFAST
jgi:hypothetical protein